VSVEATVIATVSSVHNNICTTLLDFFIVEPFLVFGPTNGPVHQFRQREDQILRAASPDHFSNPDCYTPGP
jgi:hypothetical protein